MNAYKCICIHILKLRICAYSVLHTCTFCLHMVIFAYVCLFCCCMFWYIFYFAIVQLAYYTYLFHIWTLEPNITWAPLDSA